MHKLIIVASPRARLGPSSVLLRFVRDFSEIITTFEIHATEGTGRTILGTGLFIKEDIFLHSPGRNGGVAELAAMVAQGQCAAVISFLDPEDPWFDAVEYRALKRVAIQKRTRLITTYIAAIRWATFEAREIETRENDWRPDNWKEGIPNVNELGDHKNLEVKDRSIALFPTTKGK